MMKIGTRLKSHLASMLQSHLSTLPTKTPTFTYAAAKAQSLTVAYSVRRTMNSSRHQTPRLLLEQAEHSTLKFAAGLVLAFTRSL